MRTVPVRTVRPQLLIYGSGCTRTVVSTVLSSTVKNHTEKSKTKKTMARNCLLRILETGKSPHMMMTVQYVDCNRDYAD